MNLVRKRRRAEAEERQVARDARGDVGQINRLEGAGHGHCREVGRLRERLEERRQRIEAAGFKVGTVQEFLSLSDAEMAAIEARVAKARKK